MKCEGATPKQHRALWILILNAAYLGVLGLLFVGNAAGPERWWGSSLNLYLPQWIWALPGLLLLAGTLRLARRWAVIPFLALIWVVGPGMGFCWSGAGRAQEVASARRLRVMTWNVEWGKRDLGAILEEIAAASPDLLLLQDATGMLDGPLGAFLEGWNVEAAGQYVIASRLPLFDGELRRYAVPGPAHTYMRCRLRVGETVVTVYNVHLMSPRDGLEAVRHLGLTGARGLQANSTLRLRQATSLAEEIRREPGPVILAGDLNAPIQALTCRRLLDVGLQDAFGEAGFGYGYTYGHALRLRHSYVRIDHILTSQSWRAVRCRTGGHAGSDHRPVLADLVEASP